MSFKITIEETKLVEKEVEGDFVQVGEKEVARDPKFVTAQSPATTKIEAVYDYAPKVLKRVKNTRIILQQEVDELNLNAVIAAVNNL